jgi:L-ascorbate 6-phosphate lactonase
VVKDLAREIHELAVPQGAAAMWWLAQAGFAFKSSTGTVIYLDPYLSNAVERIAGFKRLSLAPIAADDVRADWVISTHEHPDHLDPEALPAVARSNPGCRFAGPAACAPAYREWGIPTTRQLIMNPGETYTLGEVRVFTSRADHGELSPTALALLLDFGAVRVMATGDTALTMEFLQPLVERKPDVLLACINGSFGNLNATEAARLVAATKPRVAVPCHFWMFKEHHVVEGGDPETFVRACGRLCPLAAVELLSPGQGMVVSMQSVEIIK